MKFNGHFSLKRDKLYHVLRDKLTFTLNNLVPPLTAPSINENSFSLQLRLIN